MSRFPFRSLKNTLVAQFVLSALIPTLLISSLLIANFREIQTKEQLDKQLSNSLKAVLQAQFELEKIAIQFEQTAQNANTVLAPTSGIFGPKARHNLHNLTLDKPLLSAVLLVNRENWIIEASPTEAIVLPLSKLETHIQDMIAKEYLAQSNALIIENLMLSNKPEQTENLEKHSAQSIVLLSPLRLVDTVIPDPRSKINGVLVGLVPLERVVKLIQQSFPSGKLHDLKLGQRSLFVTPPPAATDDDSVMTTQVNFSIPTSSIEITAIFTIQKTQALAKVTSLTYKLIFSTLVVLAIILLIGWVFVREEVKPIQALNDIVEHYASGDLSSTDTHFPFIEFTNIAKVLDTMAINIASNQHELEERVDLRTKELQHAIEELHQINAELVKTQNQLVESEKMSQIGILVAGVAHEISTPIGVCVTAATVLQEKHEVLSKLIKNNQLKRSSLTEYMQSAGECCEILFKNLRRAGDLIQSFKAVSIDQSSEKARRFNLYEYINLIISSLRSEFSNYQIQVLVLGDKGIELNTYPGSISQVLTNLIINSVRHGFTEHQPHKIEIDYNLTADNMLTLTYSDDGSGIAPEHLHKIFDPFYTTKRSEGSSGLGLSIVYNIATQKLKGSVSCESSPGQGLTMTFCFPVNSTV